MNRRTYFTLLALGALAGAGFAFVPAIWAADQTKAEADKIKAAIKGSGKLPGGAGGANYWRHAEVLHRGQKKQVIAARPLNAKPGTSAALAAGTGSRFTTIGEPPPGFGKGFSWDRVDNEILLVMFINAADPLGISIDGVQAGDKVEVLSASGIASFSEDKGNPLASSLVGLVAAGAKAVAEAKGAPQAVPAIDAAEKLAKELFKASNAKNKCRDAFGVDPGSGHKAKQEGGLLVCLPEAGGTFYSGNGDNKARWIKPDGTRSDDHLPAHFNYTAFFPRQGFGEHNTRTVRQSGQMYVLAWDHAFDDNAGFYKVFVKLTKGNGPQPPIILKEAAGKPKQKP